MKTILNFIFVILTSVFLFQTAFSQVDLGTFSPKKGETYIIETNDGATFTGKISSYDARELKLHTEQRGDIIIPKYQIRAIYDLDNPVYDKSGNFITEDRFATRYFFTTNGLPIKKGEHYANINWFGPDFEFAISDNFGMGLMTSWLGIPIIGTAKYTIPLGEKMNLGLGGLIGNFTWAGIGTGFVIPYATFTLGNRRSNISFSGGYGALFFDGENELNNALFSLAGMHKFSDKFGFVFDSFIVPNFNDGDLGGAIIIPGIRWQYSNKGALQMGFAGMTNISFDQTLPFLIPMINWFIRIK